ncbi:MAG: conjugal transfer protein TraT [Legionella sp.]|nr:MAG: conjugal transfer protein TraT [Legionella sp.]
MKIKIIGKVVKASLLSASITLITACAATQTIIEHRSLETETNFKPIFLAPVSAKEKSIYISIENTTDQDIDINQKLKSAFREKGYVVYKNPVNAHYLLDAKVMKLGKISKSEETTALGGFGSALGGGVAGVAIGSLTKNSTAMIAGGLTGGLAGMAADALIKDVKYTMVTEIQISEHVGKGITVSEEHRASLIQGTNSRLKQVSSRQGQYERYQTRIISKAEKVNLSFKDAKPVLEAGLVKALVGFFKK